MSRPTTRARMVCFALSISPLIAVACRDSVEPSAGPGPASYSLSLGSVALDSSPSQLEVAGVVPGFGGYFLDEQGYPAVYLSDVSQQAAAGQALAGFLADRGYTAADLRVRQGSFGYAQLDTWYRAARAGVFQVPGIVFGDVDEGLNKLRFGVSHPAAAGSVMGVLTALDIPVSAILIEQHAGFRSLATLREAGRPVVGGLQINFFPTPPNTPGVSLLCTIGFNAQRFGVDGFITNSHCSNVEGGEETPTDYYQATRSGGAASFIGTEVDDPHWTSQLNLDCPPPLACRYSDAARVQYAPGVPVSLGRIARVDEVTTTLDDTLHTIAGEWRIRAKRAESVQGEIAHKTGRTTGWSYGVTTATCVDVLAIGTNHIRLCQTEVAALVDGGDSGSPVFFRRGTTSNVVLLGILWGGSVDEANPSFSYSPMSGVERELGTLKVY